MNVEIKPMRKGWLYAGIRRPRGAGGRMWVSLRTKSREEAQEIVRRKGWSDLSLAAQADALTAEVWTRLTAGKSVTVGDAIERYGLHRHSKGSPDRSIAAALLIIRTFARKVIAESSPIASVTSEHVAAFVNAPGPQSFATRNGWRLTLSGFFIFCFTQRWIVKNPAVDVGVRTDHLTQKQLVAEPHPIITDDEAAKIMATLDPSGFWHGAMLFATHFGLRIGTIATLEFSNIVADECRVFTTKGRKIVNEKMPPDLLAFLERWKQARPRSEMTYLFPVQASMQLSASSMLSKEFCRICARAGVPGKSFHGLRKNAAKKKWEAELAALGPEHSRRLAQMVAQNGYHRVQQMLGHAEGSSVTDRHYLPKAV